MKTSFDANLPLQTYNMGCCSNTDIALRRNKADTRHQPHKPRKQEVKGVLNAFF